MEIKFRYTFKRKEDGKIYQITFDIGMLEQAHGQVFDMLANDLWKLVARDLPLGIQDKNGVDLYGNDICQNKKEIGLIEWSNELAMFSIDRRYSCNKGVDLDYIEFTAEWLEGAEKVGDAYTTPELLGTKLAIK